MNSSCDVLIDNVQLTPLVRPYELQRNKSNEIHFFLSGIAGVKYGGMLYVSSPAFLFQRFIENLFKYLRWNVLRKEFTAKTR